MKRPLVSIAALLGLAALRCASVWDQLPPRLMSHFDASGRPDAFMPRDAFFATFAIAGGGTVLLLLAIPLLTRGLPPSLINIPNRDYWLPDRREEVEQKLAGFAGWTAAGTTALLVATFELVLRANLTREPLSDAMWLLIGAYLIGSAFSVVWLMHAFRRPPRDAA